MTFDIKCERYHQSCHDKYTMGHFVVMDIHTTMIPRYHCNTVTSSDGWDMWEVQHSISSRLYTLIIKIK